MLSLDNNGCEYYAHSKKDESPETWQKLVDHLINTSRLAAEFGREAGISELAGTAALAHDLGKYSHEFQQRLQGKAIRVDHSTAGAVELNKFFQGTAQEPLAKLLAYCITGHHAGLPDYGSITDLPGAGTLTARLKTDLCDYSAYLSKIEKGLFTLPQRLNTRPIKDHCGFSLAFLTRMVFSALVDADFQETETFMYGKQQRGSFQSIEELCCRYNAFVDQFKTPSRAIDKKRTETLRSCITKSALAPGFFSLTVPTGGGKTHSSMAFALNHAIKKGLRRVIYVIPFTTIIEQNAAVFKNILGEENILEHHSNFDWENFKTLNNDLSDNRTNSVQQKLKLASENWDVPIVVTTNVQFFESLFSNRSSRCRKLHNMAKSVIIFDEAQMLPRDFLLPCMYAVWELVTNYGSSAVFCTATQPELQKFLPDNPEVIELADNPQDLFDFYKRVDIENLGKVTDEELIGRLASEKQALCIVNTRRHARGLFQNLEGDGKYHLSTLMCPAHRTEVLEEIRNRLNNQLSCRVISTSVLEAGVDIDFPVGFRALAGLDSINQAAGRVNREMKYALGKVYIFEPVTALIRKVPKYIEQTAAVARAVLREHAREPISIAAVKAYFNNLYTLKDKHDFDFKEIVGCFDKSQPYILDFATAAGNFKLIEDETVSVIIPYCQHAQDLIDELSTTPFPSTTLRKLQRYTVNIYENEYKTLTGYGAVTIIAVAYSVLNNMDYYHPQTGITLPEPAKGNNVFI